MPAPPPRFPTLVLALAVTCVMTAGCGGPPARRPAPEFAGTDDHGQSVSLAGLKDKVVLLDFWATWCGPCRASSPSIQHIHEAFAGDEDVVVLGVNVDGRGDPAAYMTEHGYTYPTLVDGQEAAQAFGVRAIPSFFLIDRDGRIVHEQTGFAPGDEARLEKMIRRHRRPG